MMEDLAKQAGELLQRALDSVRAAFSPSAHCWRLVLAIAGPITPHVCTVA